jgi:hypothetical protein
MDCDRHVPLASAIALDRILDLGCVSGRKLEASATGSRSSVTAPRTVVPRCAGRIFLASWTNRFLIARVFEDRRISSTM